MMTEEEAKTKWCPFANVVVANDIPGYPAVNRTTMGSADSSCLCIASACAAWRWDYPPDNRNGPHGHCGLAGKP